MNQDNSTNINKEWI